MTTITTTRTGCRAASARACLNGGNMENPPISNDPVSEESALRIAAEPQFLGAMQFLISQTTFGRESSSERVCHLVDSASLQVPTRYQSLRNSIGRLGI